LSHAIRVRFLTLLAAARLDRLNSAVEDVVSLGAKTFTDKARHKNKDKRQNFDTREGRI
jgi:hypothetical protein